MTWKNKIVGHEEVAPDQLLAHPDNWRIHPKFQQEALRGVINDIGFIKSVTVNKRTGRVVDGHLRVTLALRDGIPLIPVEYVDLTDEEEAEALLTIDPIAALAGSDKTNLETLLNQVNTDNENVMKLLENTASDAGLDWGKSESVDTEPQIDRAQELLEKWQVKTGDLWQIGEHRLLCGDSTKREDVERLMQGEKADMTFIDPPYGVDYEGGANNENKREKIEGDETGDLYLPILRMCKEFSNLHAPMYVWFADRCGKPVYDAVADIGYKVRAMIIWNKLDAHYGAYMAQYMQKHEPCLYIVDGNSNFIGASNEVTVWDVKQPSKNEFHPTQKPIELAVRAIGNHDAPIVIDFCLGSGTTMISSENLKRKALTIEKKPEFCAVTLERMSTAFPHLEIRKID